MPINTALSVTISRVGEAESLETKSGKNAKKNIVNLGLSRLIAIAFITICGMLEKQLHQLAEIVAIQPSDALVVLVGHFNIPRGSRLYKNFLQGTGLIDTLADDQRPTHRPPRGVPAHYSLPIDFVFVRVPQTMSLQIKCDLRFSDKFELSHKYHDYISDHNAIEVSFTNNTSAKQIAATGSG